LSKVEERGRPVRAPAQPSKGFVTVVTRSPALGESPHSTLFSPLSGLGNLSSPLDGLSVRGRVFFFFQSSFSIETSKCAVRFAHAASSLLIYGLSLPAYVQREVYVFERLLEVTIKKHFCFFSSLCVKGMVDMPVDGSLFLLEDFFSGGVASFLQFHVDDTEAVRLPS